MPLDAPVTIATLPSRDRKCEALLKLVDAVRVALGRSDIVNVVDVIDSAKQFQIQQFFFNMSASWTGVYIYCGVVKCRGREACGDPAQHGPNLIQTRDPPRIYSSISRAHPLLAKCECSSKSSRCSVMVLRGTKHVAVSGLAASQQSSDVKRCCWAGPCDKGGHLLHGA
jgi:hypothetical protein